MSNEKNPEKKIFSSEKNDFLELIDTSGLNPEVVHEVKKQLEDVDSGESNIVFLFTDGPYVVTGIHVPSTALDNKPGPVLMRGANENSIIAAFSRDFIIEALKNVDFEAAYEAEEAGLLSSDESSWIIELEKMAEMVKLELASNPPEKWDDFFMGDR